jgi:hypothetical protein
MHPGPCESGELTAAMSHVQTRERAVCGTGAVCLNCPRCGLTITPRVSWMTMEHCPRCIARSGVPVTLFSSRLPPAELYPLGEAPDVQRFGVRPLSEKPGDQ